MNAERDLCAAAAARYLQLGYTTMDNLTYAAVRNRAGRFAEPNPNPVAPIAVALPDSVASPRWERVNLAYTGLVDGYPLAGLEYIVVDKDFTTRGAPLGSLQPHVTAPPCCARVLMPKGFRVPSRAMCPCA